MSTVAIVPLKPAGERKTRLAERLTRAQRIRLSEAMFHHVVAVLAATGGIDEVAVLAVAPPAGWRGRLLVDAGPDLNAALAGHARALGAARLLVVHADLPLLAAADVAALLAAGDRAAAACDHARAGTNALAFAHARDAAFAFGPDSLRRHLALLGAGTPVVDRRGLAHDVDTPDDLAAAMALGFTVPA